MEKATLSLSFIPTFNSKLKKKKIYILSEKLIWERSTRFSQTCSNNTLAVKILF